MSLTQKTDPGPLQFDDLRTPLEVANRMQWVLHYLGKATRGIKELRESHTKAKDAYSKASKIHQRDHAGQGSISDRESNAQLDNWDLYEAMVTAELALQFAKEKKSDLETEHSSLQTESKLVIAEMQMAGKFGA